MIFFNFSEDEHEDGKEEHYNDDVTKKKKKNQKTNEESMTSSSKSENLLSPNQKNFNPFIDIKDYYGGQKTSLVILPRFPPNHRLAATQR